MGSPGDRITPGYQWSDYTPSRRMVPEKQTGTFSFQNQFLAVPLRFAKDFDFALPIYSMAV